MSLAKYIRDSVSELHRVSWPTKQQAVRISVVVLAVTFALAFILGFLDTFLAWGYKALLNLSIKNG
ncbi:MAG: preprotein translocase subunit SecE [Patescibacteria group bacterium]